VIKVLAFVALCAVAWWLVTRAMAARPVMPIADAARLLGVAADADNDAVIDAHRRLIAKVHPDAGGNAELAARINQARDVLLKR